MIKNAQLLKPRPPLHKEVAGIISEKIITGEYPVRTFLPPERELCKSMGVSRTVIREAVKVLESGGLVRINRGLGTVVLEPRHDSVSRPLKVLLRRKAGLVSHLLEIRKIIEVGMVGLAAERRTPENLAAMERALQIMREKPGKPEGYVDADLEFHSEIARATQNPTLSIIMEPVGELLRESRVATFSGPRMVQIRAKQHEEIFEFIRRGDANGARTAMSKHLHDTERDLRAHWKMNKVREGADHSTR
jgi:GntR family transcriptional regulator, transcriptional repressor for pyruvate dehydrogenase complex